MRLEKLIRRRKKRRATYKMKAKIKKLGRNWIEKTELFPNVFKMTFLEIRDESRIEREY